MSERIKALANEYKLYVEAAPPTNYQDEPSKAAEVTQAIVRECLGDPTQYHGKMFVTAELKTQSQITCRVAVLATWINILTAVPAFHFGFANLGFFGLLLTGGLSGASLKWSNEAAAAAAASTKGNRFWSNQGLLFFAAINTILTAISGIGSELLVNPTALSKQLAREKIEQLKPDFTLYDNANSRCNEINALLRTNPLGNERDRLIVEARGTWDQIDKDWSQTPKEQIPVCILTKMRDRDPNIAQWQALEQKRNKIGNDVLLLKQEQPELFHSHFTSEETIKDGAKAFELAFESFFGRLLTAKFSDLGQMGFSFLVFSLSVVTSAGACLMLVAHTTSQHTQLSHDEEVLKAVLAHLQYLSQGDQSTIEASSPPSIPQPGSPISPTAHKEKPKQTNNQSAPPTMQKETVHQSRRWMNGTR